KPTAILKALHRINAQHRLAQLGVELIKYRLTQSNRGVFNDTGNNTTNGIAIKAYLINQGDHCFGCSGIRTTYNVVLCLSKVKCGIMWRFDGADLAHESLY